MQLVEGNLNKINTRRPKPESVNRSLKMSMQNDAMQNMDKNELGDYHIYSLNDKHNLGAKETYNGKDVWTIRSWL